MKYILLSTIVAALLVAFTYRSAERDRLTGSQEIEASGNTGEGSIILFVRLKTSLEEEELLRIAHERASQFAALPGLIQKYYVRLGNPGEYCGIYIWDSAESLRAYRESELAATIAQAYQATEPPSLEVGDFLFQLRE